MQRVVTIVIARPPDVVHAFAADARNLPQWSFITAVEPAGERWLVRSEAGPAHLRFLEPKTVGVLDHDVEVAPGVVVHVPMRVLAHAAGSEVAFTVIAEADAIEQDVRTVEQDLERLKQVLEQREHDTADPERH